MLAEGVPAPTIEQASSQAGYPAPVLQLSDELNLKLMRKIRNAAKAAVEAGSAAGTRTRPSRSIDRMLDEFDRPGRLEGAGFYEYADGKRAGLWPGLRTLFPPVADPSALSLQRPRGADAVHRGDRGGQVLRRGRDRVGRRRQHRLDLGHRLPGLDRRRAAVHQRLRAAACPASSPAPASSPPRTASASSRRPRWSSAPSAARPTATSARWSPPRSRREQLSASGGGRRAAPGRRRQRISAADDRRCLRAHECVPARGGDGGARLSGDLHIGRRSCARAALARGRSRAWWRAGPHHRACPQRRRGQRASSRRRGRP